MIMSNFLPAIDDEDHKLLLFYRCRLMPTYR